jgi:hypothetical protein
LVAYGTVHSTFTLGLAELLGDEIIEINMNVPTAISALLLLSIAEPSFSGGRIIDRIHQIDAQRSDLL